MQANVNSVAIQFTIWRDTSQNFFEKKYCVYKETA